MGERLVKDHVAAQEALLAAWKAAQAAEAEFAAAVSVARDAGVTWEVISWVRGSATRQAAIQWARGKVLPVDALPAEVVRRWRRRLGVVERATVYRVLDADGAVLSEHRVSTAAHRAARTSYGETVAAVDVHGRQVRLPV